jgi:hypothetical protein
MKLLKFVFLLPLATVLLLSEGRVLPSADKRGCGVSPASASQTSNPISDWQVYSDPDFKIIFQYPEEWEFKATIEQTYPYVDPYAILKRFTLIGKEGMIDFDIWSLNGYEFTDWLSGMDKPAPLFL